MAHPAQQEFCREVQARFPDSFRGTRVLEIGARNVNGSLRELFTDCRYTGVDIEPGDGVDVVCLGHEFVADPGSFDVVCSAETFEHDPHASQTTAHMRRLLKSRGLFFMSCASEGRIEHGTARTGRSYGPDPHYYANVTLRQFLDWLDLPLQSWRELYLRHNRKNGDLYFFGIKA